MASFISTVFAGVPLGKYKDGKQESVTLSRGAGGGWMAVECSSRPKKKGTAHHMKTRPKKKQPWDVNRKGPTFYPPLPVLPPDWTLATSGGAEKDTELVTVVEVSSSPGSAVVL